MLKFLADDLRIDLDEFKDTNLAIFKTIFILANLTK